MNDTPDKKIGTGLFYASEAKIYARKAEKYSSGSTDWQLKLAQICATLSLSYAQLSTAYFTAAQVDITYITSLNNKG